MKKINITGEIVMTANNSYIIANPIGVIRAIAKAVDCAKAVETSPDERIVLEGVLQRIVRVAPGTRKRTA